MTVFLDLFLDCCSGRHSWAQSMSAADPHLWGIPVTSSRHDRPPPAAGPPAAVLQILAPIQEVLAPRPAPSIYSPRPVAIPPSAAAKPEDFCDQAYKRVFKPLIDDFDNKAPLWRVLDELARDNYFFLNFPECLNYFITKFQNCAQRWVDFLEFRSMVMPRSGHVEPRSSTASASERTWSRGGEAPVAPPVAPPPPVSSSSSTGGGHGGVVSGLMGGVAMGYRERLAVISDDYKISQDVIAKDGAEKMGPLESLGAKDDPLLQQTMAYLEGKADERRGLGVKDSLDISTQVQRRMDGPDVDAIIKQRIAPLTPRQEAYVRQKIWGGGPGNEVLVKAYSVDMTRDNLRTLRDTVWLNDEVINFFFNLLQTRDEQLCKDNPQRRKSHFFNSFFISKLCGSSGETYQYSNVRRWTRKIDIFELDKVFFPVNLGNTHWCLAVIFMQEKKIQYYDSMSGAGTRFLQGLKRYLAEEWADKKKQGTLDLSDWQLVPSQPYTPQQNNSCDCGVFATSFAYLLSENLPINKISQKNMPDFRKRMALSIVKTTLDLSSVDV